MSLGLGHGGRAAVTLRCTRRAARGCSVRRVSGTDAPALGACEQPFDEALGHPPAVSQKRQIRVDQRIGCGESLSRGCHTAKTIDDPLVTVNEIGVYLSGIHRQGLGHHRL